MWEFCVQVSREMSIAADFIYDNLKKESASFGAIITKHEQDNIINIMLACEQYDKARLKIFATNIIIETICTLFKQDFLTKALRLPVQSGLHYQALKKALISFDKETDSFLVSRQLDLEGGINLESFYYFKLKSLRQKWAELTSIANENSYFLSSGENFVDLLKFLVDNLEITHDTINVYVEGDTYKIMDSRNRCLQTRDDEDLVSCIIGLSPRQINFYGKKSADEKILLLEQIFDKRLHFKSIQ